MEGNLPPSKLCRSFFTRADIEAAITEIAPHLSKPVDVPGVGRFYVVANPPASRHSLFDDLRERLRQGRLQMPSRTSEEAYAQQARSLAGVRLDRRDDWSDNGDTRTMRGKPLHTMEPDAHTFMDKMTLRDDLSTEERRDHYRPEYLCEFVTYKPDTRKKT